MNFKFLLLIPIKIYWLTVPKSKRRCCVFHESCSKYVFRITKEDGLVKGIKALAYRFNACRPGYSLILREEKVSVHLATGGFLKIDEASENLQRLGRNFKTMVCNQNQLREQNIEQ